MSEGITMSFKVHFTRGQTGQRLMHEGTKPPPAPVAGGRVPRISRLMALAIRFDELVRRGAVTDFAEIAELGQVTRARVSQIVNLLNLDPTLQEALLFLPLVAGERETVSERDVRAIAAEPDWGRQREMWLGLVDSVVLA
ncbi:MAG: hypothetical protein KF838_04905 [Phycisphaeraceae bacterium]|nr:MAG: hypothetical protein KF838_04905 [Phycisphaeraceae bacterium]